MPWLLTVWQLLRCCCRYLAFHFPFITERSMLAHLRAVPWRLDQDAFKAWRQGLTGYPLVDAGENSWLLL
jgi:deoxyribodipyrimidine photolyase